jgi:TP901 family phage tail tape measure protein
VAEVAKGIIDIEINTGSAAAQLKALQQQINAFNITVNKGNAFQTKAASQYTSELKDITNSSRFFTAETVRMRTAAGALDDTLRKGKSTLGQYFSARLNKNSALFAETMALSSERARTLQTQFIATAGASRGMQDALAIKPLAAFNNQAAIASQRTQILGQMFRQGTTQLVNFGKNVQWAGRQLMVGFTIPLSIFATTAGRTFMDLEKQAVAFKKVYGDIFTTPAEVNQNLDAVKELSKEFTKYGIAAKDTLSLAAQAAAAGRRGSDLTDAVTESTRLATLGQMDQNQALETTIALQSAFRLSGEELSDTINFLNMVENQTVVSLQDLAQAIPRVAPVIQGLGGDVKDMALFLAAMQEGGVSAAQGANALKSGLGSLINPTKAAKEMLAGFNINLDAIVNRNRGDLRGTVLDFATALQTLDEFSRQQALEQVFGKFQYARLGALFENVIRDGSQAQQVLQATGYSTEELARTADKELSVIEQSFGVQLIAAVEKLKLALAPIGEIFVKLAIPIVNFAAKIAEGFNNLPDFQKKFIALATIITGLVIPAGTMFFGLLMNLTGQLAKLVQLAVTFGKGLITKGGIVGGIQAVSQSMKYMSIGEIEASIAAKQLGSATTATNQAFRDQVIAAEGAQVAVNDLAATYQFLINRMAEAAGLSRVVLGTPGAAMKIAGKNPKKMARGGVVPGSGNSDTVPAMLMPGEFVVTKRATKSIGKQFLEQMNSGYVPRLQEPDALSRFNAMGGRIVPRRGTGRQLNAAMRSGAPIRTTAAVVPGRPVITRTNQGDTQSTKNNFVYKLSTRSNQRLRSGGVNGDSLVDEMLSDDGLSAISSFSPTGQIFNITGYRTAVRNRHRKLQEVYKDREIKYVDDVSKLTPTQRQLAKDGKVVFLPLKALHNRQVLSTLSAEHRQQLFSPGFQLTNPWRKPGSTQQMNQSTPFLQKEYKENDILPRSGEIIKPYKSKNLPADMVRDRPLQVNDHVLFKDSGRVMRWNGSDWQEVSVRGVARKPKLVPTDRRHSQESGSQLSHVENVSDMKGYNKGGTVGKNKGISSLLTPGEFVVNSQAAAQNRPFLDALNAGKVKKFILGTRSKSSTNEMAKAVEEAKAKDPTLTTPQARRQIVKQRRVAAVSSGASRIGGVAGAAALPALIAGQALSMSSNQTAQKIGSVANAITPVLFGLQILAPAIKLLATRLPFLLGPWGVVIAGVAALGVGIFALNKKFKDMVNAGDKLNDAMFGSAEQVDRFAKAFGTDTVQDRLARGRITSQTGGVSQESATAAQQFLETDAGKKLLQDLELAKKSGQNVSTALANQLNRVILAGAIGAEDAKALATEIGVQMKNQQLAIDATAKIVEIQDKDGKPIISNILRIQAELTPTINMEEARKTAEALYEQQGNAFTRFMDNIDPVGKELRLTAAANKQIQSVVENDLSATSDAVAQLKQNYLDGAIGLKEYTAETQKLRNEARKSVNQGLRQLGVSITDINKKIKSGGLFSKGKDLFTINADTSLINFTDAERTGIKLLQNLRNESKQIFETVLDPKTADKLMSVITDKLAGGDAEKAGNIFAQVVSGTLEPSVFGSLMAAVGDPELKKLLEGLFTVKVGVMGSTYVPPTGEGEDGLAQFESPGAKSAFQQLKDTYDQTMKYAQAVRSLGKEVNKEAISLIGATNMAEMNNAERKKAIELVKEQIVVQKIISFLLMSEEDQQIALLDVQAKVKDLAIKGKEQQIKAIEKLNEKDQERIETLNRQNEMDQRQTEIRNRGLEDLAKKEDAINAAYDARITALDGVQRANDRVAQQQQDRINLATALTSGDIAGAATAAAAMTQNFATGQLEDTRTALEAQQQREIDALTTSINGKMMTRAQIETEIDVINERIYQRGLSIQALEDSIYNRTLNEIKPLQEEINTITEERELINIRIDTLVLETTKKEYDQMLAVKDTNALLGKKRDLVKEIRDLYVDAIAKQAQLGTGVTANSGGLLQRMMMGGKVKGYAMGGKITYKGSREPAPGMMMGGKVKKYAFGNMVPGLGNTDRVPALLTPGEFVVRKSATKANLPLLQAINDQVFPSNSLGSSSSSSEAVKTSITNVSPSTMYNNNYSVNVNVANTDASPNDIANIVVQKIRSINDRQVRGSRY